MEEDGVVFGQIVALLEQNGFSFSVLRHGFVHSAEEAARVRGTRLDEAAKALVLKGRAGRGRENNGGVDAGVLFFQCVVSGHLRLSLRKVKEVLGMKNVSLAPPEDVRRVTGLEVGTIPPFGGLFRLPVYVDRSVLARKYVVFSAGSHYVSVRMRSSDFLRACGGLVVDIAEEVVKEKG
ncbi:hypothetical protein D6783_00300 [Candidatus Woesearchaeota archaeon]|nr:MAG: hypothetical protein D6783_00300 [Candidatus Woesearchaeota archaeon]